MIREDLTVLRAFGTLFPPTCRPTTTSPTLFETRNKFHGGEIGVLWETHRHRWTLELLGKLALGTVNRTWISGARQSTPTKPEAAPSSGRTVGAKDEHGVAQPQPSRRPAGIGRHAWVPPYTETQGRVRLLLSLLKPGGAPRRPNRSRCESRSASSRSRSFHRGRASPVRLPRNGLLGPRDQRLVWIIAGERQPGGPCGGLCRPSRTSDLFMMANR